MSETATLDQYLTECEKFVKSLDKKTIISYIRDRKGRKIGAIVAQYDDCLKIGYSLCNIKKEKAFFKCVGIKLACKRLEKVNVFGGNVVVPQKLPNSCRQDYITMFERAKRYYKDKQIA